MKKEHSIPEGIEYILSCVPLQEFSTVLDVGLGSGFASKYFAGKGKETTAIGLNVEEYRIDQGLSDTVHLIETSLDDFKPERKFDAVWFSHCLEHMTNPGLALSKIHGLLKENGWLFVCIPPDSGTKVLGGHVTRGWNLGQLMYMLVLHGFDIKNGHYISHGYNICAFVRKGNFQLPSLRNDNGDIETLAEFWPDEINPRNGFDGDISSINWKWSVPGRRLNLSLSNNILWLKLLLKRPLRIIRKCLEIVRKEIGITR